MQDVLMFVLKNLTTVPDEVKIEEVDEAGTTNYVVTVNPADVGRIIGKEGKVIKAIRTIMRVIAIQRGVHVRVSVVSENDNFGAAPQSGDATPADEVVVADEAPQTEEVVVEKPTEDDGLSVEV
jgi:predicted RNA-binding protein YlqC (UPF0109 family)